MNEGVLLEILALDGADSPAFLALYSRVVQTLDADSQARLRAALDAREAASAKREKA